MYIAHCLFLKHKRCSFTADVVICDVQNLVRIITQRKIQNQTCSPHFETWPVMCWIGHVNPSSLKSIYPLCKWDWTCHSAINPLFFNILFTCGQIYFPRDEFSNYVNKFGPAPSPLPATDLHSADQLGLSFFNFWFLTLQKENPDLSSFLTNAIFKCKEYSLSKLQNLDKNTEYPRGLK